MDPPFGVIHTDDAATTRDPNYSMPNGPSSPLIRNPMTQGTFRKDIVHQNLGNFCTGG